jgi:hypothetical protein
MVEGEERAQVEQFVHQIAKTLRDHLVNQSPK